MKKKFELIRVSDKIVLAACDNAHGLQSLAREMDWEEDYAVVKRTQKPR